MKSIIDTIIKEIEINRTPSTIVNQPLSIEKRGFYKYMIAGFYLVIRQDDLIKYLNKLKKRENNKSLKKTYHYNNNNFATVDRFGNCKNCGRKIMPALPIYE